MFHRVGSKREARPITLPGGWTGHIAFWDNSEDDWCEPLEKLVTNPESLPNRVLLKTSNTVQVFHARLTIGRQAVDVVCKQFVADTWRQRQARRLRGSRERRHWNRAFELVRRGVPTALPLAIIERCRPQPEAWVITEHIAGVLDMERIVAGMIIEAPRQVKCRLIDEIVNLMGVFFRAGLTHRDFKASNIIVTQWNTEPKLWLVDLDGITPRLLRHVPHWFSLVRLAASLQNHHAVSRTDRLRFLIRWLECHNIDTRLWKQYWQKFARRVQDFVRRAGKRKRGKFDGYTWEPAS